MTSFTLRMAAFVLLLCTVFSCQAPRQQADLIVYNGVVYLADSSFATAEAFAVKEGRFLETGSSEYIRKKYEAPTEVNAEGKAVYPGFHDAHCHFYGLGSDMQSADLNGTTSFEEILERLQTFRQQNPRNSWLTGRGWDQNDWPVKEFPTKERLDELFPDTPVLLTRVDGHAALVNQKALSIAGITEATTISGGDILKANGKPTGVLIDNAIGLVRMRIPRPSTEEQVEMLLDAQKACFEQGLTCVSDAGLLHNIIDLIDSLQTAGVLKIRVNAMINPIEKNYYFEKGPLLKERIQARSFKIYSDGALGSRGACLLQPYADSPGNTGFLLSSPNSLKELLTEIHQNGFQANTHCIGDSANRTILKFYADLLGGPNDRRWRIEHCQVVNPADLPLFGQYQIIPSVHPTHATSDMYWAGERLGPERLPHAYAFRSLLEQNGLIAVGSDFPVEAVSPVYDFHAAVARQDGNNYPEGGFQMGEALSREQALLGITRWAAYAAFWEKEIGSISPGKWADFVIADQDLMRIDFSQMRQTRMLKTFVAGEMVHSVR